MNTKNGRNYVKKKKKKLEEKLKKIKKLLIEFKRKILI
jgi:hypothetical protein